MNDNRAYLQLLRFHIVIAASLASSQKCVGSYIGVVIYNTIIVKVGRALDIERPMRRHWLCISVWHPTLYSHIDLFNFRGPLLPYHDARSHD